MPTRCAKNIQLTDAHHVINWTKCRRELCWSSIVIPKTC